MSKRQTLFDPMLYFKELLDLENHRNLYKS